MKVYQSDETVTHAYVFVLLFDFVSILIFDLYKAKERQRETEQAFWRESSKHIQLSISHARIALTSSVIANYIHISFCDKNEGDA